MKRARDDELLLSHQLKRLARRATLGLARTVAIAGNGSGDIFLAFSTANAQTYTKARLASLNRLPNAHIDPLLCNLQVTITQTPV